MIPSGLKKNGDNQKKAEAVRPRILSLIVKK